MKLPNEYIIQAKRIKDKVYYLRETILEFMKGKKIERTWEGIKPAKYEDLYYLGEKIFLHTDNIISFTNSVKRLGTDISKGVWFELYDIGLKDIALEYVDVWTKLKSNERLRTIINGLNKVEKYLDSLYLMVKKEMK